MAEHVVDIPAAVPAERVYELPSVDLPRARSGSLLLSRAMVGVFALLSFYFIDKIAVLLMEYWLLESLGFTSVFWTNFWAQAALFAATGVMFAAAVGAPALVTGLTGVARTRVMQLAVIIGMLGGFWLSRRFRDFLLYFNGESFGVNDRVFGNDIGFYLFELPAIWDALHIVTLGAALLLVSSLICSYLAHRHDAMPPGMTRPAWLIGIVATPVTLAALAFAGVFSAIEVWLMRFNLLWKDNWNPDADNWDAGIHNGPQYLDITGFFSTRNAITVEAIALLLLTTGLLRKGAIMSRAARAPDAVDWRGQLRARGVLLVLVPGAALTAAMLIGVELRGQTQVTPNEPVIQLPYIQQHIDATLTAWGMDKIEQIPFEPKQGSDPKPSLERLLEHPTIKNASLWPGYVSAFERQVDPEYVDRILAAGGDTTIYGPTIDTFRAQQKFRPYYDFMDIDTTRYFVNGTPKLFASATREVPLVEPQPWLAWWGQSLVIFTHGYGLVAAPISEATPGGEPVYTSGNIPQGASVATLNPQNPRLYYGEGGGSVAFSNLQDIKEHDYPTDQGRAEFRFPPNVDAGVEMDSFLKRLVIGWKSRSLLDILLSDLIDDESRVHLFRTPLERVDHVAPFLYLDSDPYAVKAQDRIMWMVNGMTTSDKYPQSARTNIGDKADVRTPTPRQHRHINYVRDSVKITVDAYTGKVRLYPIMDEPVLRTWSNVYPDLFEPLNSMPQDVFEQRQYPVHLMHTIFDDLYIYYHVKDPLTFFSLEDYFDDADEVKGALIEEGRGIAFSIEPYYWLAETGKDLPASERPYQFSMSMLFTPESALNLRSMAVAYMEGKDYGKLSILEVPKGRFYFGPEQADTIIDQDAFISQQIGLWNRLGLQVIRGHTTALVVDGEVIYVEPLFIKSVQNPVPQLKRVVVVFRGEAHLGETLDDALRAALDPGPRFPVRPGPELGGEPGFVQPTAGSSLQEGARVGGVEPAAGQAATPAKTDE